MDQQWLFTDAQPDQPVPDQSQIHAAPVFTARDYQGESIEAIEREFGLIPGADKIVHSTLLYLATGLGKTECFVELARRHYESFGRIIIVEPTKDLVKQAAKKVYERTGIWPAIEQGPRWSDENELRKRFVVASRDSLHSSRIERFKGFGLLILDEGHHYSWENKTTQTILGHFRKENPNIKILGCTATPHRQDDSALGRVYDTVAYTLGIAEGVELGWLCGAKVNCCTVKSLDFSGLKRVRGDLERVKLQAMLEEEGPLHEIADVAVREGSDKLKTLYFAASVNQAEELSHLLTERHGIPTSWVCGDYKRVTQQQRHERLEAFKKGELRGLVNVAVLTEGWDAPGLVDEVTGETIDPGVEHIVMARPTQSITAYMQMFGRGTRTIPGTVDFEGSTPALRKEAIAASAKPFLRVTDLVDNSNQHRLVTATDVLAGTWYPDEVKDRAAENIRNRKTPVDFKEALEIAKRQIEKERKKQAAAAAERQHRRDARARAVYDRFQVNPFDFTGMKYVEGRRPEPITDQQLRFLKWKGFQGASQLTKREARQIINRIRSEGTVHAVQAEFNKYMKGEARTQPAARSRQNGNATPDDINAMLLGADGPVRRQEQPAGGVTVEDINRKLLGMD